MFSNNHSIPFVIHSVVMFKLSVLQLLEMMNEMMMEMMMEGDGDDDGGGDDDWDSDRDNGCIVIVKLYIVQL